jgi:hypothetical protein
MLHFIMRDKRLKAIDPLIRLGGGVHVPEERGCQCGADLAIVMRRPYRLQLSHGRKVISAIVLVVVSSNRRILMAKRWPRRIG